MFIVTCSVSFHCFIFIFDLLFYFHLSNSSWSCAAFFVLCHIYVIAFIMVDIIIFLASSLAPKVKVKHQQLDYFFSLDSHMKIPLN